MERIDGDDRREWRRATGDVVALGDEGLADASTDRCRDARETQLQLRSIHRCFRGVDLCFARIQRGGCGVKAITSDNLLGE
jgi:hypothetical protein